MLPSPVLVRSVDSKLGSPGLTHQVEDGHVLGSLGRGLAPLNVKLEVDEEITVINIHKLKNANVSLLFLIDLPVAVVADDAFVESTGSQSILSDEVEHGLVLELADGGLLVAQNVHIPRLIEQELLHAKNTALSVDLVVFRTVVGEGNKLTTRDE